MRITLNRNHWGRVGNSPNFVLSRQDGPRQRVRRYILFNLRREDADHVYIRPYIIDPFHKLSPRNLSFSPDVDYLLGLIGHGLTQPLNGFRNVASGSALSFALCLPMATATIFLPSPQDSAEVAKSTMKPFDAPLRRWQAAPHTNNTNMGNRVRVRVDMSLYKTNRHHPPEQVPGLARGLRLSKRYHGACPKILARSHLLEGLPETCP
jgi:hypothetical protein